jgi:hypothetical protein
MDSPVLWCSLPQILPSFLIYLRNVGYNLPVDDKAMSDNRFWLNLSAELANGKKLPPASIYLFTISIAIELPCNLIVSIS